MKLYVEQGEHEPILIKLTLSRRNLRALLAKLDGHPPNSECTIKRNIRETDLEVAAEEDEPHYANREIEYIMHPDTEAAIA